ncbi:unnamed protein product [Larinioides sclopetarius]|uniref:WW domain-containing protein n=1 Tax=Larinioides sclopetarius TaxID=280406 RepID=A0AAV1ZBL1_9ARAC
MGKKLKGGRRQILQLEEKKPPKVPSKSKVKSLIHYSDSDDDSKKSNESESSPSTAAQNKDATPLESQIADFFKEIDALSVPDELLEEADKATPSSKAETGNENNPETCSSDNPVDLPASASKKDKHSDASSKEAYCPWQEICDSSTGYSYYWNVNTNEVTWDCPTEYADYIQSFNASTEKTNHAAQNDNNTDVKEKKKKKHDIVVPEGAIIPISYFGNSSSSDDSSDSESESSNKKPKSEKVTELKKSKITKKIDSRSKTNVGEINEIIGPSLPPDFQFPVTESAADETDSLITVSQNEVSEFVKVGSSLPLETLSEIIEKPSQSDLDEFPAESSTNETSWENSLKDTEKRCAELNEKPGDASPDSTEKKGDNPLVHNIYQVSNNTYGLRPVVEYDSFTDEDEEICVANISSSKPNADEKHFEIKPSSQQEQDSTAAESSVSMKALVETESKMSNFKRKASEILKESTKKEELIKKPKRSDVNIDSLFASHSSYGKYGFGFGWQKELDEQNEELCTTSSQDYKTHKHQSEFKVVSFVKSEDILDLKALNNEIVCDETNHALPDGSVQTKIECDQSNTLDKNETPILNNEELMDNTEAKENIKISSDNDVGSSSMISIKDKIDCSILNRKKKNGKFLFNAASTSLKVEDDLDEIDKALCEALDAKKSAKNLSLKSSSPVSGVTNTPINMLESTSISGEKIKETGSVKESCDENAIDTDAMTDDILEISSELIDKLTFLLSAPSTHASFSGVFFQLQTRFVDWQAGALDSTYFMARLKELEQYIQHYETGVISGEWTYQWDRCDDT